MAYSEGDERRYFSAVLAALIILAFAIGTFVYSLVKADPEELTPLIIEDVDGEIHVNPGGGDFPTSPPSVPYPSEPPPVPLNN